MSATPIFDLEQKPPDPPKAKWIAAAFVGGALGLVFALLPATTLRFVPGFNSLLFLPALYVAVVVCELGHLVVGSSVGMPPGALVTGAITIFKSGQRWLIRFDYRQIFSGGREKALPEKGGIQPAALAWMMAGGPIAGGLFTVVCVLAYLKFGDGQWAWIGTLLWMGLLITIIPFISISNRSDGARLRMLWKRPGQSRSWMALWAVQTEGTRGVVPREWDEELVGRILAADPDATECLWIQLLAFYRCSHQKMNKKRSSIWRMLWLEPLGCRAYFASASIWKQHAVAR